MKKVTITDTGAKATWDSVTVELPETLKEAEVKYGNEVGNGFMRFMIHSLPIKLRQACKHAENAQIVVDSLFTKPCTDRINESPKKVLLKKIEELGLSKKDVKGLTVAGLQKVIAALEAVKITSPPVK